MKKLIIIIAAILSFSFFENETNAMHRGGYFYTELSPYGTWIELDYGTVVWRPTVMRVDWAPYSYGRWIWTSSGWYWDSYDPFGYIVFHYGRWYYDDYYGWIWIPDNEWAPAWVEWRYDNDYIGWAPLSPYASFSISVGIYFTNSYYVPYSHWHFVTFNNFCHSNVYNYYVGPTYKYRIYSRTKTRTNYDYYNGRVRNRGVDLNYVEVRSGQKIRQRDIYRESDPVKYRNMRDTEKERIVTFDADRDALRRENVKNLKIEKGTGRSTLDVSKVEFRKNDNVNRNRNTDVNNSDTRLRKDVNNQKNDVQKRSEVNSNREIKRNNDFGLKNSKDTRNIQKDVKRQTEVKSNTDSRTGRVNTDRNMNIQKKTETQIQRKESVNKVETKKNPVVKNDNRQVERKVDTRNNTARKNDQQIKRDSGNSNRTINKTQDTRKNTSSNNNDRKRTR